MPRLTVTSAQEQFSAFNLSLEKTAKGYQWHDIFTTTAHTAKTLAEASQWLTENTDRLTQECDRLAALKAEAEYHGFELEVGSCFTLVYQSTGCTHKSAVIVNTLDSVKFHIDYYAELYSPHQSEEEIEILNDLIDDDRAEAEAAYEDWKHGDRSIPQFDQLLALHGGCYEWISWDEIYEAYDEFIESDQHQEEPQPNQDKIAIDQAAVLAAIPNFFDLPFSDAMNAFESAIGCGGLKLCSLSYSASIHWSIGRHNQQHGSVLVTA